MRAYDESNNADKSSKTTPLSLWDPPCYLEVDDFVKTDQVESLDHLSTQFTY